MNLDDPKSIYVIAAYSVAGIALLILAIHSFLKWLAVRKVEKKQ